MIIYVATRTEKKELAFNTETKEMRGGMEGFDMYNNADKENKTLVYVQKDIDFDRAYDALKQLGYKETISL